MRFTVPFVLAGSAALVAACVHEEHRPAASVLSNEGRAASAPATPVQYLLGDPSGVITHVVPLNGGAIGVVVDKRRVVLARGEPRLAAEQTAEPIHGAEKLPSRFGGGFLFWTDNAIYRADAFDSALVPVARTSDRIDTISFGPKSLLVRTGNGERWGVGLPKGERVALAPVGIVDLVALDEGRALSFDDRGSVFSSVDHGAHWTDATAQVRGRPVRVFLQNDELWLEDDQGSAMRLEPDGHLSWFDKVPEVPTPELRPRDPRWRGVDFPLRVALRAGVALDDSTALVIEAGDVYRIDTHTGDVVSVLPGKLPPDSSCQGMMVPGDAIFACMSRSNAGASFVVSHTLGADAPVIEQTFGQANLQFFASDDGGLAYGGPCASALATGQSSMTSVCVRTPSGAWEERDLSALRTDAGVPSSDVNVVRWIPRADGRAVAIVTEPETGIYDPGTGVLTPVSEELRSVAGRNSPYYPGTGRYRPRYSKHLGGIYSLIDSSWSHAGTAIRGTSPSGETFEITEDGAVKLSPYGFESIYAHNLGVGKSKDGRLFQTSDHGGTWTEVATPPTGMESLDLMACSNVGCDFGPFYRLGWQLRPPRLEPAMKPATPPPSVRRVRGVELACRTTGAVAQKLLVHGDASPDDFGLGAARVPSQTDKNEWLYLRTPIARGIAASWGVDPGVGEESSPALRMLLSGFSTTRDDSDVLVVNGPTKNLASLRRGVSYVGPFDPTGRIVRTGISLAEVAGAARRAGVSTDEIFAQDPTENGAPFTITPQDPTAAGEVASFDATSGLLALFKGERTRLVVRAPSPNGNPMSAFSGVALPGDEVAILETESGGPLSHVYKVGPSGNPVDLFDYKVASDTYHPANPDALAIGPKSELAIIRTPSGSDPPSELDPAYLVMQGGPPVALAAWSTLKLADDPACKSEPGGHRVTLQAIGPWIRVSTPDLKVEDGPMLARVRWTAHRVCLEGFEVKMPTLNVSLPMSGGAHLMQTVGTWLVGKGSTFARVTTAEGIEWRQPLECSVTSTGP